MKSTFAGFGVRMRNLLVGISAMIALTVCVELSYADPTLYPRIQGSGFYVGVNNTEGIGYNCNVSYRLNYLDFGTPRFQDFIRIAPVHPSGSGDVLIHPTAFAATGLSYSNFNYTCYRAQSTSSSSNGLPGGSYSESCVGCSMRGSVLSCSCDGHDTTLNLDSCSSSGRNLVCNREGTLNCTGGC